MSSFKDKTEKPINKYRHLTNLANDIELTVLNILKGVQATDDLHNLDDIKTKTFEVRKNIDRFQRELNIPTKEKYYIRINDLCASIDSKVKQIEKYNTEKKIPYTTNIEILFTHLKSWNKRLQTERKARKWDFKEDITDARVSKNFKAK